MKRAYGFRTLGRPTADQPGDIRLVTPVGIHLRLKAALNFFDRLRGLIGSRQIDDDFGLLIPGCRAVHTMGMRFAIDLVFVNRDLTVLRVASNLRPMRFALCSKAAGVIELASGASQRVGIVEGCRLEVVEVRLASSGRERTRAARPLIASLVRCVLACLVAGLASACTTGGLATLGQKFAGQSVAAELSEREESKVEPPNGMQSSDSPHQRVDSTLTAGPLPKPAEGRATRASKLPPDELVKLRADAESAYQSGRLAEALSAFTQLTQAHPDFSAAWLRVGNIHHQRGANGQAIRAYRLAARSGDTDPETVQVRAKALFNIAAIGLEQAAEALEALSVIPLDIGLSRDGAALDRKLVDYGKSLARERNRLQGSVSSIRPSHDRSDMSDSPAPVQIIRGQMSP
jgi:hypothetical protein